jgi:hypothetical protein
VVAAYVAELELVLSADRLSRYRKPGADDLSMIVQYLWNVELCETLYQSLGALEMALRNAIHTEFTAVQGQANWFDVPRFLLANESRQVADAKRTIQNAHKPVSPGRVIAGLTFGFWVAVLSRAYSQMWTANNQALVRRAFPHAPVGMLYRPRVHTHMNNVRLLRNRVFHFECVADDPDIVQKHEEVLDAIGWINPTWQLSTRAFDRFPRVYAQGYQRVETKVKAHLGIP